jgi:hypothetical protein
MDSLKLALGLFLNKNVKYIAIVLLLTCIVLYILDYLKVLEIIIIFGKYSQWFHVFVIFIFVCNFINFIMYIKKKMNFRKNNKNHDLIKTQEKKKMEDSLSHLTKNEKEFFRNNINESDNVFKDPILNPYKFINKFIELKILTWASSPDVIGHYSVNVYNMTDDAYNYLKNNLNLLDE